MPKLPKLTIERHGSPQMNTDERRQNRDRVLAGLVWSPTCPFDQCSSVFISSQGVVFRSRAISAMTGDLGDPKPSQIKTCVWFGVELIGDFCQFL
jgi:hypothetical protein